MRFKIKLLLFQLLIVTNNYVQSSTPENFANVRAGQQFLSTQRSLPVVKIDTNGKVLPTQLSKQQLANELGLPLRDLRIVDPSFPTQIQAAFMARPRAILFCIENIKVVIKHDEAVVFSPYQKEVVDFIPALQQQISQSLDMNSIDKVRFEHVVLEAALNVVCSNLNRRIRSLSPAVASTLNGLRAQSRGLDLLQQTQVDELLPLKNKIDELRKRVKEIKRAINDILNNDEDMILMYLESPKESSMMTTAALGNAALQTNAKEKGQSECNEWIKGGPNTNRPESILTTTTAGNGNSPTTPTPTSTSTSNNNIEQQKGYTTAATTSAVTSVTVSMNTNTMDLEMLFENYLMQLEWITSDIEELLDEIINTEENVVLQLDLLRNRILRFELFLSMSSFVVSWGALFTGLFGMNLINHMETHRYVFYMISGLIFSGMAALFLTAARYGRRERLF